MKTKRQSKLTEAISKKAPREEAPLTHRPPPPHGQQPDANIDNPAHAAYLKTHPCCQAVLNHALGVKADKVHFILKDRPDMADQPQYFVACCQACFDWIQAHPVAAKGRGLLT